MQALARAVVTKVKQPPMSKRPPVAGRRAHTAASTYAASTMAGGRTSCAASVRAVAASAGALMSTARKLLPGVRSAAAAAWRSAIAAEQMTYPLPQPTSRTLEGVACGAQLSACLNCSVPCALNASVLGGAAALFVTTGCPALTPAAILPSQCRVTAAAGRPPEQSCPACW
jgi:hypothetical protein